VFGPDRRRCVARTARRARAVECTSC
jgi:hypothetical protein